MLTVDATTLVSLPLIKYPITSIENVLVKGLRYTYVLKVKELQILWLHVKETFTL